MVAAQTRTYWYFHDVANPAKMMISKRFISFYVFFGRGNAFTPMMWKIIRELEQVALILGQQRITWSVLSRAYHVVLSSLCCRRGVVVAVLSSRCSRRCDDSVLLSRLYSRLYQYSRLTDCRVWATCPHDHSPAEEGLHTDHIQLWGSTGTDTYSCHGVTLMKDKTVSQKIRYVKPMSISCWADVGDGRPYSAGIHLRRHKLTTLDVRFWCLKTIPAL